MNGGEASTIDSRLLRRAQYCESIAGFVAAKSEEILGSLTQGAGYSIEQTQRDAWVEQIEVMKHAAADLPADGMIAFEFVIPRMGKRIDVLLACRGVVCVLEFKVNATSFASDGLRQVWDYALDLKNFHSTSHRAVIVPILIATGASEQAWPALLPVADDKVVEPLRASGACVKEKLSRVVKEFGQRHDEASRWAMDWAAGMYQPTPTIVEAAVALYGGHRVEDISRKEADAVNLAQTSTRLDAIIQDARARREKVICFVTGVPGAGKTLVGLDVATRHQNPQDDLHSVLLSGNGPLVKVLREALAIDRVRRSKSQGKGLTKDAARREVEPFIQNVHHFRDACLRTPSQAPVEHVVLFDEAQRAWNEKQTSKFMDQKKGVSGFGQSEPEFLISCMDRHADWAVIVCLVGGGQEINTGEAGIGEWLRAIQRRFAHWRVCISPQLHDLEYEGGHASEVVSKHAAVQEYPELHLSVSMRSFRAERVSGWVKAVLDGDVAQAQALLQEIGGRFPIVMTRSLMQAKNWLRARARGCERYGLVVSSQAHRLKPLAVDVRGDIDPVHWFLHDRNDVRSSFYLEDAATEFVVQGLELDWTCVVWDADFRRSADSWACFDFKGTRWQKVRQVDQQVYLKNAYRVLLTRARQGMVIVVPEGEREDPTREPSFYDGTFAYLCSLGIAELNDGGKGSASYGNPNKN